MDIFGRQAAIVRDNVHALRGQVLFGVRVHIRPQEQLEERAVELPKKGHGSGNDATLLALHHPGTLLDSIDEKDIVDHRGDLRP